MLVNVGVIAKGQINETPQPGKVSTLSVVTVLDKDIYDIRGNGLKPSSKLRFEFIIPREATSEHGNRLVSLADAVVALTLAFLTNALAILMATPLKADSRL